MPKNQDFKAFGILALSSFQDERVPAEDGNGRSLFFPFSFVWRQFSFTFDCVESAFGAGAFPVFLIDTAKAMTMARFLRSFFRHGMSLPSSPSRARG
jgi:hypothetical protein